MQSQKLTEFELFHKICLTLLEIFRNCSQTSSDFPDFEIGADFWTTARPGLRASSFLEFCLENFRTTSRASTGLLVKNVDMTSPVLAQGVVRKFYLDGFEFYDSKLP
jgi:hypothetical protein